VKRICNTNARFEQLPTVLQQYKSTDEKIIIFSFYFWIYKAQQLICYVTRFETLNESTSFKTLQTSLFCKTDWTGQAVKAKKLLICWIKHGLI
jgi:hypothetical protein